jgi:hypothetical protein
MDQAEKRDDQKLGPHNADAVAQLLANLREHLPAGADPTQVNAVINTVWTIGQTPEIADEAQYISYARQADEIWQKHGGSPMSKRRLGEFQLSPDGALWMALVARMKQWRAASGY